MKHLTFYLDFISPYAYLAFEQLPHALEGLSYTVNYQPVLFAALLAQHGQRSPGEIAPKRAWIFRQALWLAHRHGIPMQMPAAHPFNPLPLLRLARACGAAGQTNRHVCTTLLHHVWRSGADAAAPERLRALTAGLAPARDPASPALKAELRAATDAAAARGVFGVPTFAVDGQLFWGLDALPMLREYLESSAWFAGPGWMAAQTAPQIPGPEAATPDLLSATASLPTVPQLLQKPHSA